MLKCSFSLSVLANQLQSQVHVPCSKERREQKLGGQMSDEGGQWREEREVKEKARERERRDRE
jgi:hypothetical protein